MDDGIPSPAERKVAERILFPLGWTLDEVAVALKCSAATVTKDLKNAGVVISRDYPNRATSRRERFVHGWRLLADQETSEVIREQLRRVLNYEEMRAAHMAAIEVCRAMQDPDLSALPEWQQRLVEMFGGRRGDWLWDDGGYYWPDLMNDVRLEEVMLTFDLRENARIIAAWVEQRMNIRAFVRPRICVEWAEKIEEAVEALSERNRFVIRARFADLKTYPGIGRDLGCSNDRVCGILNDALGLLRHRLRDLGRALQPYAAAAPEREQIAELERSNASLQM